MLLLVGVLPLALVSSGLSMLWIILLLKESFLTSLTVGMDFKLRLHKTNLILKQRLAKFYSSFMLWFMVCIRKANTLHS